MENRSYLGSITKYSPIGGGAYSTIYLADYFDSIVAYKELLCNEEEIKKMKPNLEKISHIYDESFAFPYRFIYAKRDDKLFKGYVMPYLGDYITLDKLQIDYLKKIEILKKVKYLIEKLHNNYKVLHGDISPWNIMYNVDRDDIVIIDFDLCKDLESRNIKLDSINEVTDYYTKNIGIDVGLDMFLFNLTTYSILNDKNLYESFKEVLKNNFGVINDKKAIEVFKSYKDINVKSLKKEYVIDYL